MYDYPTGKTIVVGVLIYIHSILLFLFELYVKMIKGT